jgi:glyoxalase family protein
MQTHIHQGQPVLNFGASVQEARLVVIMLHGRGATASGMLPLVQALDTKDVSFWLPQAAMNRWYPYSAFGPIEMNEPDLSSALEMIDQLTHTVRENGFSDQQLVFGGFSQGGCLAAEYVARNARKYSGLFVFSGALIGPKGMTRNYSGAFDSMPVFIGGSDVDPWVEYDLIQDTASTFEQMGAQVDFQTYPGMAHTVNQDEIDRVRAMLSNKAD